MKDETIRLGDLVVVIKSGCTNDWVGFSFIVGSIKPANDVAPCEACGGDHGYGDRFAPKDSLDYFARSRLKKINPPAVDETVETSYEVTV